MASTCSDERKGHISLSLNQKLAMIRLSEEGMSNAKTGRKLGLLGWKVSLVNEKEKFLKEIKSTTPVKTWIMRKWNSLIAIWSKFQWSWIEGQTSYSIPFSQSPIQSKALTLFNSVKAERSEGAVGEKLEASRGWFTKLRKEAISVTSKYKVKWQVLMEKLQEVIQKI